MTEEKILRCGSCRACCQMGNLVVTLDHGDENDLAFYKTNEYKNQAFGLWEIKKSSSGACIYLKPHGCSIYSRRPHACKNFDCRKFIKRDFSSIPRDNPTFGQIEELRAAARAMVRRDKQSIARRFNAALGG